MTGRRWIGLLGMSLVLTFALGWGVVGAKAGGPKKAVDWVALNPAFQGAAFVNDPETCRSCHDEYMNAFADTKHARAFAANPPEQAGACESCHGPRSQHVENPTAELKFEPGSRAESAVCLQCHEGGSRMGWKAGAHQANDVSCSACHHVMERKSQKALLIKETAADTCYTCHGETKVEFNKMSHHPVREGRLDCAGCHNVHGSNPMLLLKPTQNDTCFTCHTEKRGPFVWEHAPAREDCGTCHTPHGSNNRSLLTAKDPFLCLSCHSYGGHINLPRYNRVSNPYGNGCSNCHMSVHGSNHPSGAKLTR
jgi:DmsE family decaheme c-type cytochrome